ncbi:MAG: hypothetical protein QM796_19925 [Chthoniobacteraceae bacterium]
MKKQIVILGWLLALVAGSILAKADSFSPSKIVITGTLQAPSNYSGAVYSKTRTIHLSTRALLDYFGYQNIATTKAHYWYDTSTSTLKLTDLSNSTVYATLATFDVSYFASSYSSSESWNTTKNGNYQGCYTCTALNDQLAGVDRFGEKFTDSTQSHYTFTDNITAFGPINGIPVILSMKVTATK